MKRFWMAAAALALCLTMQAVVGTPAAAGAVDLGTSATVRSLTASTTRPDGLPDSSPGGIGGWRSDIDARQPSIAPPAALEQFRLHRQRTIDSKPSNNPTTDSLISPRPQQAQTVAGAPPLALDSPLGIVGLPATEEDLPAQAAQAAPRSLLRSGAVLTVGENGAAAERVEFSPRHNPQQPILEQAASGASGSSRRNTSTLVTTDYAGLRSVLDRPRASYLFIDGLAASDADLEQMRAASDGVSNLELRAEGDKVYLDSEFTPSSRYGDSKNTVAVAPLVDEVLQGQNADLSGSDYLSLLDGMTALPLEAALASAAANVSTSNKLAAAALRQSRRGSGAAGPPRAAARLRTASGEAFATEAEKEGGSPNTSALDSARSGPDCRFWSGYFGSFASETSRSGYSGYETNTHGVMVGATVDINRQLEAGIYGGVTKSELEMKRGNAEVESDGYHAGGYLRYRQGGGFSASVDGLYSRYNNDLSRRVAGERLKGSYSQDVVSAGLELAYEIDLGAQPGQTSLTPFARGRYTHLEQENFNDKGDSPLAMRAGRLKADQFSLEAGAQIAHVLDFDGFSLKPSAALSWEHLLGKDQYAVSTEFRNYPGASASIRGVRRDRDALKLSLNLESIFRSERDISVNIGYILDKRAHGLEHSVFGGLEIRF